MDEKLKELKALAQAAQRTHAAVVDAIESYSRQRNEEFAAMLAAEVEAKFGDNKRQAHSRMCAAAIDMRNEADRLAREGFGAPLPVGTRMVQWDCPYYGYKGMKKTGAVGVVEVITKDSNHPKSSHRRADIGDAVIRLLKKDGTPGKSYVSTSYRFHHDQTVSDGRYWHNWHPKGVDPNVKEVQA